jgi:predicted TIM-barrel fold metal-dependent hydrolase
MVIDAHAHVGNLSTGTGIPDLVDAGFGRRLVYGSGAGVSCITPFRDVVLYSGISQEASRLILYDNAIRLSRLPE